MRESLERNYHVGWRSVTHYSSAAYEADVSEHVDQRLAVDRRVIVPFLDAACGLAGRRILEIGCGTGSSTVALAEQGAEVTGVDIDEGALQVARDRCGSYALDVRLLALNSTELRATFEQGSFDMIIFFACLEHMTVPERVASLRDAWQLLPEGGFLSIVETPNRLWFFDAHTSWLPFFHWLPDELALEYSRFSPRDNFADLYAGSDVYSMEHFLRRGRGVSYHELDLAIGPVAGVEVVNTLARHQGWRGKLRLSRQERRYRALLESINPTLPDGFAEESLYVVLRKGQEEVPGS